MLSIHFSKQSRPKSAMQGCSRTEILMERMKPNNRNWLTADILKAMNNRDHMKNTASSTNDPTQWAEYRRLRNQATRNIQKAKRTHYKGLVQNKTEQYNILEGID